MKFKMVEKIITTEDDALLNEIKSLLGLSEHDFWDDLSESARASVQRGLEQSGRGETRSHEDMMNEIRTRFPKV